MKKTRAAIIGLGRIASLLEEDTRREKPCTHAGAITSDPDCVLVGGCDTDKERRRLFAKRWNVPVYSDAAEMLCALNPEILAIATHPDSHYHYCRMAADAGVPVIICEKPLADNIAGARKIAALSGGRTTIITNHERRYSADYLKAREILAGGSLGAILSVRAVLCMGKDKRLLDVFWHDGTHLADSIMFLTDSVLKHRKRWGAKLTQSKGAAWLEGELLKGPKPQTGGSEVSRVPVQLQSSPLLIPCSPLPCVIEIGAGRDYLVFEMEFSCAKGRLRIGNGVFEVWESDESPYAEKFRSLKRTCESFKGPTGYFASMIADAVSIVKEPGRKPISSAEDGLRVIEYLNSVKAWHFRLFP